MRKNNWNSESYRFDEVFTESASQKRVYDVVAKPVVEVNRAYYHIFKDFIFWICRYCNILLEYYIYTIRGYGF